MVEAHLCSALILGSLPLFAVVVAAWYGQRRAEARVTVLEAELRRLSTLIESLSAAAPSPTPEPTAIAVVEDEDLSVGSNLVFSTREFLEPLTSGRGRRLFAPHPKSKPPRPEDVLHMLFGEGAMPALDTPETSSLLTPGPAVLSGEEWFGRHLREFAGGAGLLLLIGILLGETILHGGPWGRVAACLAAALGCILAGAAAEGRPVFRDLPTRLLTAGWVLLLAVVLAMVHLPALRVLESPHVGAGLLGIVGVGTIIHSLRYRRLGGPAIVFSVLYVALSTYPIGPWVPIGSAALTAALLLLADRREFPGYSLLGLIAHFAVTAAWMIEPASLGGARGGEVWLPAQCAIGAVWFLFELAAVRRAAADPPSGFRAIDTLTALNHAALLVLSHQWMLTVLPEELPRLYRVLGAVLATNAAVRWAWEPALGMSGFRIAAVSAALAWNLAVWNSPDAQGRTGGFLLESAVLLGISAVLRDPVLRAVGWIVLAESLVRLLLWDFSTAPGVPLWGRRVPATLWTFPAAAALCAAAWRLGTSPRTRIFARESQWATWALGFAALLVVLTLGFLVAGVRR